jgi:hypothetical protein
MKYYDGDPISAPPNYQGYRHIYEVGSLKKWVSTIYLTSQ